MARIARIACAAAFCLGLQAQESFAVRMAAMEKVMDRYYRGERLEDAISRSNREIQAFNARTKARQSELDEERRRLDSLMGPDQAERERLAAMDQELKAPPKVLSQEVTQKKVEQRNALARQINERTAKIRTATEAYNALVRQAKGEIELERQHILATQKAVNERLDDYEAFTKEGRAAAFFIDLNRLLAGLRQALRTTPGEPGLSAQLQQVRSLRRELATWAMVGQGRQANGLVIVETLVADEPCWFVVDTGAMDTIVSEEIITAIGLGTSLGTQSSLSVVGGIRVSGLACHIPSLTVAGQTQTEVDAAAVRPSDVGIDGLLGQSFLKAFVYTIDERTPAKLILTRR
jgi:hypothetical protein